MYIEHLKMNVLKTSNFLLPLLSTNRGYNITSCTKLIQEPILISSPVYSIKDILSARKLKEVLKNSSIVAFYHFYERGGEEYWTHFRERMGFKEGIRMKVFSNAMCQAYLSQTKYKNLLPIFVSKTITVYTTGPAQRMVKLLSKQPQLILLGGIFEGKLLGADQLKEFGKLPEKELLQGEVVAILNKNGEQLRSMLEQNQRKLISYLTQIGDKKREFCMT